MSLLGELVVRIKADADPLKRGMDQARTAVTQGTNQMSSAFGGLRQQILSLVPALSAVAFTQFAKGAFDAADQLDDFRKRTGFAVESLSALKTPLLIADSNLEEFSASIARMNNLVGEAATGLNQEVVRAFDTLGLSVGKLRTLSPEQQFYEIARSLGSITNEADFVNAGMAIFGRSFVRIAPLIKDANGEVEGFVENAKALGNVITQDQVDRIGELNDRWTVFLEDTKKGLLELLPLVETLANVPAYLRAALIEIPQQAGRNIGARLSGGGNPNVSTERPASVNYAVFMGNEVQGPAYRPASARGSNAGMLREQTAATKELTEANKELDRAMQEAAHRQALFSDRISQGMTDVVFSANSASDAVKRFTENIARMVFEAKVAQPFADAIIGRSGSPGLIGNLFPSFGSLLGFADGGRPPVGVPSIVGERGPELFVPDSAGTVIPNHALGGQSVTVYQSFNLNPGATEQTVAQLRNLVPSIMAETKAAVFSEMQRGGTGSKIIGARN